MRTHHCGRLLPTILVASLTLGGCDWFEEKILERGPGERLYNKHCASCHGMDGRGNTVRGMGNPLNDLLDEPKYGAEPETMENLVRQGVFAEMPSYPELNDLQVRQIIDHVLKLRGDSRRSG
jgi:mono/diheme cytochrome c family protein